jgi:hypothetical protein
LGHCNLSPLDKKVFNSVSGTIPLLHLTAVIKQFGRIFPRTLKMKGWVKYVGKLVQLSADRVRSLFLCLTVMSLHMLFLFMPLTTGTSPVHKSQISYSGPR